MANRDPQTNTHPSPLAPYSGQNLDPLPTTLSADGKSLHNDDVSSGIPSPAYTRFEEPISNAARGGWDVHVYWHAERADEVVYAAQLWERVRREFPELRIYPLKQHPIGPHPLPMFETNVFTPAQFGALVAWLAVHRGPLGALVHPNTGDELADHAEYAFWFGDRLELKLDVLRKGSG